MQADEKKKKEKEKKPARRRLSLAGFLLVALFGAVSGALSLGIATGAELRPFFLLYFREPVLLLLNIAPVVLLHLMVYMIFGRPWLSFFLSTAAVFITEFYHKEQGEANLPNCTHPRALFFFSQRRIGIF